MVRGKEMNRTFVVVALNGCLLENGHRDMLSLLLPFCQIYFMGDFKANCLLTETPLYACENCVRTH